MKRLLVIDPRPSKRDHLLLGFKTHGYHLTGVTPVAGCSGLEICDEQIVMSFHPIQNLIGQLQSLPPFDGVVCYHQAAIHIANRVAHALGLRPAWANPELDLSNKTVIQSLWEKASLPVPKRFAIPDEVDRFPVVAKPSGLQGQIGVKICHNRIELKAWAEMLKSTKIPFSEQGVAYEMTEIYNSDRNVLIQEKIEPDAGMPFECSAEFFVYDGQPHYLGGFDKTAVDDPELPNEELVVFPHVANRPIDVKALTDYVLASGFQNGFCHLEYKISGGRPIPIELNARLIGSHADLCLQAGAGIDVAGWMAAAACGEPPEKSGRPSGKWHGYLKVHLPRRFTNRRVTGFRFSVPVGASFESLRYLQEGEEAELWESCVGAPIGVICFVAEDMKTVQRLYRELGRSIEFEF